MLLKKLTIILIAFVGWFSSQAHSQTEIGYRFNEEDEQTYLEVHLTSLTLFDMIYDLYPHLMSRESLNLNHYAPDYEIYFNKHIDLKLNGKDRNLKFIDSNLSSHDAKITFLVQDMIEGINQYEVSLGGFEFYRKPSFTVLLTTSEITQTHFLTREENTCKGVSSTIEARNSTISETYYWMLIVVIISGLLVLAMKARRLYVSSVDQLALENG